MTTGNVLSNDLDANSTGSLLITAFDAVSVHGGVVTKNGDNTFTYTPPANFSGTDTFTYTVTDGIGNSAVGTVTVSVAAATPAPTNVTPAPTSSGGGGTIDPLGVIVLAGLWMRLRRGGVRSINARRW